MTQDFWSLVDVRTEDECWPWREGKHANRYGVVMIAGRKRIAHRHAWEITNGPIPAGLIIRHKCDNKPCCNPAHLEQGTHQDNARDRLIHGDLIDRARYCEKGHLIVASEAIWYFDHDGNSARACAVCQAESFANTMQALKPPQKKPLGRRRTKAELAAIAAQARRDQAAADAYRREEQKRIEANRAATGGTSRPR